MIQSHSKKIVLTIQLVIFISVLFFGCEKKQLSIIESKGDAPTLINVIVPNNTINTDTVDSGISRSPDYTFTFYIPITTQLTHINSLNEISKVKYSIECTRNSSILGEGFLKDDGKGIDTVSNDGYFSGYLNFQVKRYYVGKLNVSIWGVSISNYVSNKIIIPINITRTNNKPLVSNLTLPDTVNRKNTKVIIISIKADDLDSHADIQSVFRVTASGRMFKLYDNGLNENGDLTAGDGFYSEKFDPTPPSGQYTLRFFAIDYSGDSSNVITKQILIIE